MAVRSDALRHEGVFRTLRVEGSEDSDGFHYRGTGGVQRTPTRNAANRCTSAVSAFSVGRRSIELAP